MRRICAPTPLQFFFDILVAAVDVIHAVDDRLAFRHQRRQHQRSRSPQIGSQHRRRAQWRWAAHHRAPSFDLDVRAHAHHFQRVHEPVLENVFRDDRRALGLGGQRHVLRLHVGGEAGILFGHNVRGFDGIVAHHAHRIGGVPRLDSDFGQLFEQRAEMRGIAARDVQVSAGHGSRNDERGGFDAVRNDSVFRAVQLADALHPNGRSARAFDLRSHLVEQVGEVGDFGLAGAILHHGFALGQGGGHEQVFRAGHGDLVEHNFAALEPVGAGLDVSVVLRDFRAQAFQSFDVKIDGTRADSATAREEKRVPVRSAPPAAPAPAMKPASA